MKTCETRRLYLCEHTWILLTKRREQFSLTGSMTKRRVTTISAGLIAFGLLAIGMGLSKRFALYLILMVIYGVAITMVQTATTTLIQEKAEASMQGRVFGLLGAMYSGFLPAGMAIFGPMADKIALQWIMIGSGIALIALSVFVGTNKEMCLNQEPPAGPRG